MRTLLGNIYTFYRDDCCWPYAASFYLTLVIFGLDFGGYVPFHGASFAAYAILLSYYLYLLRLYFKGRLQKKNLRFFVAFLSFKIAGWAVLLVCVAG